MLGGDFTKSDSGLLYPQNPQALKKSDVSGKFSCREPLFKKEKPAFWEKYS